MFVFSFLFVFFPPSEHNFLEYSPNYISVLCIIHADTFSILCQPTNLPDQGGLIAYLSTVPSTKEPSFN